MPATSAQQVARPHFTDVAESSGVRFRHSFGSRRLDNILMTTGSGTAFVDYDSDGWLDALLLSGTPLDGAGNVLEEGARSGALFRNNHGAMFAAVTAAAGISRASYSMGVTTADFDGDGLIDLYITNYGANTLYRNLGDGTFEDVTAASATAGAEWSTGAEFFDYDGDGDLDLYVANYLVFRPDMKGVHASALSKRAGMGFFPSPRDYEAESDVLYRNDTDVGAGFIDVSAEVGLIDGGKSFMPAAVDFDDDGDLDLFVANDSTPNLLYRNDAGVFTEVGLMSGLAFDPQGVETGAMGVDVADIDGDGLQDLYVTNYLFEFNNFYRNRGALTFEDTTKSLGLDKDNYRHVGWATRFADFNNDGRLDCFVANGHVSDYVEGLSGGVTYGQRNALFLGDGKGRFEDVSSKVGEPFKSRRVSRGAAFGDYDNDGDIDILLSNSGGSAQLLRNDLEANDRWVAIRLAGRTANRQAVGARLRVIAGESQRSILVRVAGSYLSSSDPTVHIGLDPGVTSVEVEVTWPSGSSSSMRVGAGTRVRVTEPGGDRRR